MLQTELPIQEVLPQIQNSLIKNSTVVLQAPPGAGKSTVVPISLLEEAWLSNKIIIMLEPRRVAARMVATQMAKALNEEVGETVGYQIKMDNRTSSKTKIVVLTEAILVRKLQSNQSLDDVALIIFDEFHERSIHTDLSLALSLQVQELLREDLKLLIMSATLNSDALLCLLGDVPVVTSLGRSFEIENVYLKEGIKPPNYTSINQVLLETIFNALDNDEGDILVFLAGTKEIKSIQKLINEKITDSSIEVLPLYSALNKKEQDKALYKNTNRKIILSTNIAQTSLTIEGVRIVIDTGFEKQLRYHHESAMDHLDLTFISQDSAIQRAGRAGRLSSGKCYKLWHEKKILQSVSKPEILRCDLSSMMLDLSLWGTSNLKELHFLDLPNEEQIKSTKTMLYDLQMVDAQFNITSFGAEAIRLGVHPRFAYMILQGNEYGHAYEACLLCTLLSNGDVLNNYTNDCDIRLRFDMLINASSYTQSFATKMILKETQSLFSKLKSIRTIEKSSMIFDDEMLAVLLLLAYPDRLAKKREHSQSSLQNRYKLSNSKGAYLKEQDGLFNSEFLVVSHLNGHAKDSFIQLALPISLKSIEKYFQNKIEQKSSVEYNHSSQKFDAKSAAHFLQLELYSEATEITKSFDMTEALLNLIKQEGLSFLQWSKKSKALQSRVIFANKHCENRFFDMQEESLLKSLSLWLEPYLNEIRDIKALHDLDLYSILLSQLSWSQQQELDVLVPKSFKVPSGSNIQIDYSSDEVAVLSVKIQELFGLNATPMICNHTIALQVHLLSPALRPIQITYDLKSFWDNAYDEVRKELRGKYKKHYWPQDPYKAQATKKTKKFM